MLIQESNVSLAMLSVYKHIVLASEHSEYSGLVLTGSSKSKNIKLQPLDTLVSTHIKS